MVTFISINGRLLPANTPCITADDRGFTLGDGVFETIRARNGRPLLLQTHLQRLRQGAQVLEMGVPSPARLAGEARRVLEASRLSEAVLRLSVSRGAGQRGLAPASDTTPTVIVSAQPFQPYPLRWYDEGVSASVTGITRNEHSPLAGIKSLSYVEQVLARLAAQRGGSDLGLLLNTTGHIVSADCANLFIVRERRLLTPPLAAGALPGVARQVLLNIAGGLGLETAEVGLTREDLDHADEVLLTNVLLEVAPLVRLDDEPVGGGRPGRYAAGLRRAYRLAVGIAPP